MIQAPRRRVARASKKSASPSTVSTPATSPTLVRMGACADFWISAPERYSRDAAATPPRASVDRRAVDVPEDVLLAARHAAGGGEDDVAVAVAEGDLGEVVLAADLLETAAEPQEVGAGLGVEGPVGEAVAVDQVGRGAGDGQQPLAEGLVEPCAGALVQQDQAGRDHREDPRVGHGRPDQPSGGAVGS